MREFYIMVVVSAMLIYSFVSMCVTFGMLFEYNFTIEVLNAYIMEAIIYMFGTVIFGGFLLMKLVMNREKNKEVFEDAKTKKL